jgi:hypothetical protein
MSNFTTPGTYTIAKVGGNSCSTQTTKLYVDCSTYTQMYMDCTPLTVANYTTTLLVLAVLQLAKGILHGTAGASATILF